MSEMFTGRHGHPGCGFERFEVVTEVTEENRAASGLDAHLPPQGPSLSAPTGNGVVVSSLSAHPR